MNTPASAVVPSREAVEAYFKRGPKDGMFTAWVAEGHAMLRTLYAEVERLTNQCNFWKGSYNHTHDEREQLRATVAEQGAALAELEKKLKEKEGG
jgi:hypothetical protein